VLGIIGVVVVALGFVTLILTGEEREKNAAIIAALLLILARKI